MLKSKKDMIGKRIKVKVHNTQYKYRDRYASYVVIPEYNIYVGRVLPKAKWLSANQFMLTTGDHESPVRILDKSDIVEAWIDRKKVDDGVTLVDGDASTYVVTRGPLSRYSCTCTAFRYRGKCSHIDSVRKAK